MASVVVLQARTGSTRLPAKVLLPVQGVPLAVLAALRAANTGRHVVVATSTEPDDDVLAETLARHGLSVYRGSLHNTLARMTDALATYADDTVVVRLTADNVFPDGHLIDEIEADFLGRGLDYLACNGVASGLPYGVSVEITRLRHLRDAARATTQAHDLEHVTPFVIRQFGATYFDKYKALGKGHYRCTVDLYEDYIGVCKVFAGVADPVHEPVLSLVERLAGGVYQPVASEPVPALVLGTAQLGMPYGLANESGQPDQEQAEHLLKTAIANGVAYVDTAHAYGTSEAVIGQSLAGGWAGRVQIVTKLSPLADCAVDADQQTVQARVDASVFESCKRLRQPSLDVLMLHRAAHLSAWQGAAWHRLLAHQSTGLIGMLGVSVQNPQELEAALDVDAVRVIQLPFNLLDGRWAAQRARIEDVKRRRPLIVHVRSTLLQGLLGASDKALWRRAHVADQDADVVQAWLKRMADQYAQGDVIDLCLRYARSQSWIDGIVVGVETVQQLMANIRYFNEDRLQLKQCQDIEGTRPHLDDRTLDPSRWLTS